MPRIDELLADPAPGSVFWPKAILFSLRKVLRSAESVATLEREMQLALGNDDPVIATGELKELGYDNKTA